MSLRKMFAGSRQLVSVLLLALLMAGTGVFAQDTAECEAGFRSFTHALGETCIPEAPQRVVVLDTGELDNALALGATIVGAPVSDAVQYQAYLSDQLDGIADTGTISEPNFEAILELQPDLILGSKQRYEAIYPQLSEIAPTVFTESLRVPWQDNFRFHADALGKTAEAEELIAAYDAHIADLQTALGDRLDTVTVSVVRFRPGQVRLYLKSSYIGYILQDVGLQRPESQDQDVFSAEISIEEMQQADGDYIFVTGYDVEDSERETFLNSPLWQTLEGVQSGNVIDVNDDTWIAGLGIQAANLVLDDLATLLGEPATASFPVTVEHKYGSTTIEAEPVRVVSIGFSEQDMLLAVGVTPIAVRYWYGDETNAIFPWAQDKVEGENPIVLNMPYGALNYEAILALDPDLISAVSSGITEDEYNLLSEIAPTIAQSGDYIDFGMPWQEATQLIGDAVGKSAEAAAVVAEVEAQFEAARDPEWEGQSIAVIYYSGGTYGFYTDQDIRGRFFTELGFVVPQELVDIAGEAFYANISAEQVGLLDRDVIAIVNLQFVEGGLETLLADPLFASLDAVQAGNIVYFDVNAENALGFSSPLSLPYALDAAIPQLEAIYAE